MRTFIMTLYCWLLLGFFAAAQHRDFPKNALGLKVGDTLPEIIAHSVYNYSSSQLNTNDLRGKLVILDFWNSGCSSCVAAFPKMQQIQDEFEGKVQVVLVNQEKKERVLKLTNIVSKLPHVPAIMDDTALHTLFPHFVVPHHVWIDGNGVVLAITDGFNTSSENIRALLNGKQVEVSSKRPIGFRREDPLINLMLLDRPWQPKYYTVLFPVIPDHQSFGKPYRDSVTGKLVRHTFYNYSIIDLYKACLSNPYTDHPFYKRNRIIKETELNALPDDEDLEAKWEKTNVFSYEIQVTSSMSDSIYTYMAADLNRLFGSMMGITARVEKRVVKSLVLTLSDSSKLVSRGGKREEESDTALVVRNYPFQLAVTKWSMVLQDFPEPFIDNTHFTGNVDLDIKAGPNDLDSFKKALKKYGLNLTEKDYPVDMLVIKKAK